MKCHKTRVHSDNTALDTWKSEAAEKFPVKQKKCACYFRKKNMKWLQLQRFDQVLGGFWSAQLFYGQLKFMLQCINSIAIMNF